MDPARAHYESSGAGWGSGLADRKARRLAAMRREAIERAEREVSAAPPGAVLEIGPGLGDSVRRFAASGRRVHACDLTATALAPLADVARRAQGDARRLPYRDASFSAVFANSILMFLPPREAFAEMRRVLAPGGRAVVLEPLARNPFLALYRRFDRTYEKFARWRNREELLSAARDRFDLVREFPFYLFAPWAVLSEPWRRIGAIEGPIARAFPDLAWILVLVASRADIPGSPRRRDRDPLR